ALNGAPPAPGEPAADAPDRPPRLDSLRTRGPEAVRPLRHRHRDDLGEHALGDVGGQPSGIEGALERLQARGFLRIEERRIEGQYLLGEGVVVDELAGPATPPGPTRAHLLRRDRLRHQIFSMFTRNSLNSRGAGLGSPTNPVNRFRPRLAPVFGAPSARKPR